LRTNPQKQLLSRHQNYNYSGGNYYAFCRKYATPTDIFHITFLFTSLAVVSSMKDGATRGWRRL